MVASIGVYVVLVDASRALQAAGVDVLVIRSGPYKGTAAQWGAAISQQEMIDQIQHCIDQQARHFTAAVARGRKMTPRRVAEIADGRVFIGVEAIEAGLVDRISTLEEVVDEAYGRLESSYQHLTGRAAAASSTLSSPGRRTSPPFRRAMRLPRNFQCSHSALGSLSN